MAGQKKPYVNLIVSQVGLVPKKKAGEYKLIHHLSYPEGTPVNDGIAHKYCSVQYTSFDEAVHLVQKLGKGCKLFKMDLKNAFRLTPICSENFELLGIYFKGHYFVDKPLPFGASVKMLEMFSSFIEFFIKSPMTSSELIQYVDDF